MAEQSSLNNELHAYPFRILHIFFSKILFERTDLAIEEEVSCQLVAEIGLDIENESGNRFVNLRVRSTKPEKRHLDIEIVAVGIFEHVNDEIPTDEIFTEFVNENLLVAMSSRVIQLIANLSNQMGIPPVWMPTPRRFGFSLESIKSIMTEED